MEVELKEICCNACGVIFLIPDSLDYRYQENHKSFYCPNGHSMSYPQKTALELEREISNNRQIRINQLEAENRRLRLKPAVKKIKKTMKQGGK